ncbi:RBBP9/YdeN family alpha/beta hydrolase [Actinoalloteichus spitiensis]|uniref:RBBP9/YdeN family alpha/beta hydrolase n=1 Tax=Actinoalloteichus spitiensis TaxID=252394 RepID=UPI000380BA38|nr:alpha/beta hydrolase [Actinoalloteichus spitiensis]
MSDRHVLLVHGWQSPARGHWQLWLSAELRHLGWQVHFPRFPSPGTPVLRSWLPVLRDRLASVPRGDELVVLAHCVGATLWLHHAATLGGRDRRVDRVLLAGLPGRTWNHPDLVGLRPPPPHSWSLRRAAGITRMVCGSNDPIAPVAESQEWASALRVGLDVVPDAGHLDTESGFGPWPGVLEWALNPRAESVVAAGRPVFLPV